MENVEQREGIISGVTDRLEAELNVLSEFLDNVARRRPKGSRFSLISFHSVVGYIYIVGKARNLLRYVYTA